ncbi:MAG: transposase family protein [Sulfuriferula multivorans]|uniref:Transposase family protein n=1 Tax=Sulfuriferula multivorans TaxID=1559896 RepID=A0A7C9P9J5_9PROT|nr:transposase family protein [Sulfuriferula multivorans]
MQAKPEKPQQRFIYRFCGSSSTRQLLAQTGMQASMNGRKTAYDNAVAERFISNLNLIRRGI